MAKKKKTRTVEEILSPYIDAAIAGRAILDLALAGEAIQKSQLLIKSVTLAAIELLLAMYWFSVNWTNPLRC